MSPQPFWQIYQEHNESLKQPLVWHTGVDAGFFAEYSAMLNAMLYCIDRGYQFRLYSADANYGYADGWTDYFKPLCPEETAAWHHRYNIYGVASWRELHRRGTLRTMALWKSKLALRHIVGHARAWMQYGRHVRLSDSVKWMADGAFSLPGLSEQLTVNEAFIALDSVAWRFNATTQAEVDYLAQTLRLPRDYAALQIRGGDKVTETALLPPERYAAAVERYAAGGHVLVLTDDYTLFERLQQLVPTVTWHTLCDPADRGYVNAAFTRTAAADKRQRMVRFLATMHLCRKAGRFIGSITTGPSLYLLRIMGRRAVPIDCDPAVLPTIFTRNIAERSRVAMDYLAEEKKK